MSGQVMGKETQELLGEMNAEWPRATNVHYNFPGLEKHRGMNWDLGPGTCGLWRRCTFLTFASLVLSTEPGYSVDAPLMFMQ